MFNLRAAVCLRLIRRGGALLLLAALGLPAVSGTGLTEPSAAMTPVASPLPPDAPREGQNANEMDEIRQILDFHYHFQRLDGRNYGLPENDFDDATNISLRRDSHRACPNPSRPPFAPTASATATRCRSLRPEPFHLHLPTTRPMASNPLSAGSTGARSACPTTR